MLNMFKSNNKQTVEIITNESSLMVKQFENLNITIYGSYEEPLFKAKDIGELLEMKNIREVIKNFNNKQKGVSLTDTPGGKQEVTFLTEQGLYKVLMKSRKLELIKYKEKVYEEIEKTGHIYVIKTDGGTKVGKTKDAVKKRIKGLQTGNMNDIQVLLDFKTSNADLLERTVHYILDRYRCNSNREFFDCDVDFIKTVVETIGKVIDTLKSCYQQITKEQILTKLSENGIKINLEINSETGSEKTFVNEEKEESELYNWLNNNIELDKNGILKLKKICELYLDTDTIYPKLSNKIRLEIESWIKTKFKHLNFQYKDSYLNGERYRGWCGLKLK